MCRAASLLPSDWLLCVRPYLFVNLQKLLHSHFLVPGYPEGSVDAPEAASSTVLVEEQVLMLYLHKRRARGRHGILTHAHTNTRIHAQKHTHTRAHGPPPQKKSAGSTGGAGSKVYKPQVSRGRVKGEKERQSGFLHGGRPVLSVSRGGKKKVLEGASRLRPVSQEKVRAPPGRS